MSDLWFYVFLVLQVLTVAFSSANVGYQLGRDHAIEQCVADRSAHALP